MLHVQRPSNGRSRTAYAKNCKFSLAEIISTSERSGGVFLKSTAKVRRTFGVLQIFEEKSAKNLQIVILRLQSGGLTEGKSRQSRQSCSYMSERYSGK